MLHLALPASCRPWLPALAWYLRQNLLIFLHSPKYTDSNSRNHFQVRVGPSPYSPPTVELFPAGTARDLALWTCIYHCLPHPLHLYFLPMSSCAPSRVCPPFPTVDTIP